MRIPLAAGLTYFLCTFATGFALGLIRVPFLVPRVGERWAELIETPLMFVAIWFYAGLIVRRFALATNRATLICGASALLLLLAAELLMVMLLWKQPLADYVRAKDPVAGSVYLLMLLVFALMPTLLKAYRRA